MVAKDIKKYIVPRKFFANVVGQEVVVKNLEQLKPELEKQFSKETTVECIMSALLNTVK